MILDFRLNSCPICLICLDCQNEYGQKCTCQARNIKWKKKKVERDYIVDFCHKPLSQKGATNQKVTLDPEFVDWFLDNISPKIILSLSSPPNDTNVCNTCISRYRSKNKGIFLFLSLFFYIYWNI